MATGPSFSRSVSLFIITRERQAQARPAGITAPDSALCEQSLCEQVGGTHTPARPTSGTIKISDLLCGGARARAGLTIFCGLCCCVGVFRRVCRSVGTRVHSSRVSPGPTGSPGLARVWVWPLLVFFAQIGAPTERGAADEREGGAGGAQGGGESREEFSGVQPGCYTHPCGHATMEIRVALHGSDRARATHRGRSLSTKSKPTRHGL